MKSFDCKENNKPKMSQKSHPRSGQFRVVIINDDYKAKHQTSGCGTGSTKGTANSSMNADLFMSCIKQQDKSNDFDEELQGFEECRAIDACQCVSANLVKKDIASALDQYTNDISQGSGTDGPSDVA